MAFLNYSVLSKDTQALSSNAFTASKSFHLVDTEGNAANDQIDTINGGVDGGFLILQISSAGRDSWLIEGGGNVKMQVDNHQKWQRQLIHSYPYHRILKR